MTAKDQPTRRFVIGSAALASGGLALGVALPGKGGEALAQTVPAATTAAELTAWIVIRPDETVIVRIAKSELGQGTMTGLAQLAAEELDCNWSRVVAEQPGPGRSRARGGAWGDFTTTTSRGIRASQDVIRRAAAAARLMLIEAAAAQWQVPTVEVTTEKGFVRHVPTRRLVSYGRIAPAAAALTPPDFRSVKLKDPRQWTIAGKPLQKLDIVEKLNGQAVYGIDVRLPGMLYAAIKDAPTFGTRVERYDVDAIRQLTGVRHVLGVGETAVAVVADSWWQAKRALDALPITWSAPAGETASSETIREHLKDGLEVREAYVGTAHGDALKAIYGSAKKVEAVYSLPYLHQTPLEPMNCTARWTPERVEVWVGTQNAEAALRAAAEAAGHPLASAEVHRCLVGGAFGRRGRQDFVTQAVRIARQIPDTPVKLVWSREEDMTNGYYRPATMAKLTGGIDEKGEPAGLIFRISGQSLVNAQLPPGQNPGRDARMFLGLYPEPGEAQIAYSIPNVYIDHAMRTTPVPVGSWRGVHANQNAVFLECFIDEMARAAGKDPVEFRRGMMRSHPRHLAVMTAAAATAGWGRSEPEGPQRGLAQLMSYGSYVAAVAEAAVSSSGRVRVSRIVVAIDCGHVVNPDLVAAQVEGQVAYALGAMMHQEITIKDSRISETNFDTYPSLTMSEMPRVETVLVPSGEFWGGVGESVVSVVVPAVLNAIFAASGKRVRTLPLKNVNLN